jgi:hypothetical protein
MKKIAEDTLANVRLLLTDGIGYAQIIGHKLDQDEIEIASNILATGEADIPGKTNNEKRRQQEVYSRIMEKLFPARLIVNTPGTTLTVNMIEHYEIANNKIKVKFNNQYSQLVPSMIG